MQHLKQSIAFAFLGLFVGIESFAQGTVNFSNRTFGASAVDAPIFGVDGTSRLIPPSVAQLYAGPDAGSLAPIGAPVPFETGDAAGYFFGGPRVIDSVAPGAVATVLVRVWDMNAASTWESALNRCESSIFSVVTGGAGEPPSLPADLVGLQSFSQCPVVPEPSTFLLAIFGGAIAVFLINSRRTG